MITLGKAGERFLKASKGHNYPTTQISRLSQQNYHKFQQLKENFPRAFLNFIRIPRFLKCPGLMDMVQIVSYRNLSK